MDDTKVRVVIYGNEYTISGERDSEKIREISKYVDSRMREIGRAVSNNVQGGLGVLTAVNIAAELFDAQEERDALRERAYEAETLSQDFRKRLETSEKDTSKYFESRERTYEEMQILKGEHEQLEAKYRELETSYFDIQMENVQLKSKLEKLEQESEKRSEDAALADVERRAMEEIKSMGGVKELLKDKETDEERNTASSVASSRLSSSRRYTDSLEGIQRRPARSSLLDSVRQEERGAKEKTEEERSGFMADDRSGFSPFKGLEESGGSFFEDGFTFNGGSEVHEMTDVGERGDVAEAVGRTSETAVFEEFDEQDLSNAFDAGGAALDAAGSAFDAKSTLDLGAPFDNQSPTEGKSPLETLNSGDDSIFKSLTAEPKSPLEAARVNSGPRLDYKSPIMSSQFLRDREEKPTEESVEQEESEEDRLFEEGFEEGGFDGEGI